MRTSIWLIFSLGCMLGGCTAQEPTAIADSRPDLGRGGKAPDMLEVPTGPLEAPVLDPTPAISQYMSVPIHGQARGGTSVIIDGGANGSVSADVSPNGVFCADVALAADAITNLSLRTIDANGNESPSITASITQSGTPPTGPSSSAPKGTSVNASLTGTAWASFVDDTIANGKFTTVVPALIDGSDGTAAVGGAAHQGILGQLYDNDIAYVRLSAAARIDKLVIKPTAACPITAPATVYIAATDTGTNPFSSPNTWTSVQDFPAGSYPSDGVINISGGADVWWIALSFPHVWYAPGGVVGPTSSLLNCGSYASAYVPSYGVSEIQAWTVPNGIAPPPPAAAPSCTSGQ